MNNYDSTYMLHRRYFTGSGAVTFEVADVEIGYPGSSPGGPDEGACYYRIKWPGGYSKADMVLGRDSLQALLLALSMVEFQLQWVARSKKLKLWWRGGEPGDSGIGIPPPEVRSDLRRHPALKYLDFLSNKELPPGFTYPRQFQHLLELGLIELQPWYLLDGKPLRDAMAGLAERYPERKLVPFAQRQDNNDIACWQVGEDEKVFVIHDGAPSGEERSDCFPSFYDWFRCAIEDLIAFDCREK